MLKKKYAIALCGIISASLFAACSTGGPTPSSSSSNSNSSSSSSNPVATEGDVKTGLAVVTNLSESGSVADGTDGKGKAVFTAAAVLVDDNGTIVSCDLDTLEADVTFSGEGKITSDLTAGFKSKNEKGASYNMKQYSGIQKEWDEQAKAFSEYVVGKTADEIANIAMDNTGKPTDADLLTGCTIAIPDFVKAVAQAAENATVRGASAEDTVSVAISVDPSSSKDAGETDGAVDLAATIMAASFDTKGTFTSAYTDSVEAVVNFTSTGEITSDLEKEVVSKYDLKDSYNMKAASPIQKEWYEQADGFSTFVVGRTLDDISAAITDGYATDADLAATCTINMYGFMDVASKVSERNSK